ncbi:hypothetical protein MMC14_004262 [Varicellaria rhodocarpa]|nr:hypothetical protein [Varicellaria rhodocarpa]
MNSGLVDLSLFAVSPTSHEFTIPEIPAYEGHSYEGHSHNAQNDHRFYDEIPAYQRYYDEIAWQDENGRTYRSIPHASTNKPLPPLPRRRLCERRVDPRREDINPPRCILARMRRVRTYPPNSSEGRNQSNSIQQRRNTLTSAPQLTLTVPQLHLGQERGRPAVPMVWMADEQMWLIADDVGFDTYHSSSFDPQPYHTLPRSARSEPYSARRDSELSPVRSQFRTLMERRSEQRSSPDFQDAVNGVRVPIFDYEDYEDPSSTPGFGIIHDWQSETSRNSWHSAISGVSALSEDPGTHSTPSEWEGLGLAIELNRPLSALR